MPKIFENKIEEYSKHVLPIEKFQLFSDIGKLQLNDKTTSSILAIAEEYLQKEYQPILAHSYMRFEKNGNRNIYEDEYFERRVMVWYLFLGEYIEKSGRFLEKLIDGIWLILDECSWVIPAHTKVRIEYIPKLPLQYKNEVDIVDLFSAETGAMLSLISYLGKEFLDGITPIIRDRILYEVRRRVISPYLNYNDFWWMGYTRKNINNWCPWIASNVLAACALVESEMETRCAITKKSMEILDHFTRMYHDDGGCDEGPNYWTVAGASYFDCLEVLYDITGGYVDVFNHPFIQNLGEYIVKFCINIDKNYYINFADSGPCVRINKNLIRRFGRRTNSKMLQQFGTNCEETNLSIQMRYTLYRSLKNLFEEENLSHHHERIHEYPLQTWFEGIEVMAVRESSLNHSGFFFAMKGGHNRESHNHNDVGHFLIYDNGEPLIIDVGVGTYCADTFNENRYKIWTMKSCYHNLPSFNDIDQMNGFKFHADNVRYNPELKRLSMDLKNAYPGESDLVRFSRTGQLEKGIIRIKDEIELKKEGTVKFHFMVVEKPQYIEKGILQLSMERNLYYNPELDFSLDEIKIEDSKIINNWKRDTVYRIILKAEKIQKRNFDFSFQ